MNLIEALEKITNGLKEDIEETNHFIEQCSARQLNFSEIIFLIKNNKILGIIEQQDNIYKVWFYYDKNKDLNIIVRIMPNGGIKIHNCIPMRSRKEKKMKAKGGYSLETDIFTAFSINRNYESSFGIGNFIFDLDKKGKITGIEILNASDIFKIPKEFLHKIKSGKVEIETTKDLIKVSIKLKTTIRNFTRVSVLNFERIKPDFVEESSINLAVV